MPRRAHGDRTIQSSPAGAFGLGDRPDTSARRREPGDRSSRFGRSRGLDSTTRDIRRDAYAFHFERASLYVAEHLGDTSPTAERIADTIGLSSGHLQEVFRKSSGHTIADYVRQQRLAMPTRSRRCKSLARQHHFNRISLGLFGIEQL